ncbi:MAG: hypothetical protein ACXVKP_19455, partial [Ilumatobacteraceae bacterium]
EKVRTAGGATPDEPERSEPLDLEALVRSSPQAFDDLREPGEVVEPAAGWAVEQQADAAEEPKAEALEVGAEPGVAVEPVEAAAVPAVVAPPNNGVEHTEHGEHTEPEHEHVATNGNVVVAEVNDPDATSLTAERPAAEPAAAPGRTS